MAPPRTQGTRTPAEESQRRSSWVVTLPSTVKAPLSLNGRGHWRRTHDEIRRWRRDTAMCIRGAGVPALGRVDLVLHVWPPDRRRRDSDNLVAVLKPIKDGVVDAKVVPDDTPAYVDWHPPVLHDPQPPRRAALAPMWRYELVLTGAAAAVLS